MIYDANKSLSDLTFECTGREVYAHLGIVGLSQTLEHVHYGYDGCIDSYYNSNPEEVLTAEERRELADYMIGLWNEYATKGLKKV